MSEEKHRRLWSVLRTATSGRLSAVGRNLRKAAERLRSTSLKTRVVLLVVGMLFAGIWALALGVVLALQRDLTQLLSTSLAAEAVNAAEDLDRDVRLHVDALARLAASLAPEMPADAATLHRALYRFVDSSAVTPEVVFVSDRSGFVIATFPQHPAGVGTSIENFAYFRDAISGGKAVIGAPVLAGERVKRPALPIAVPLLDGSGATVGALVSLVLLSDPLMLGQLDGVRIGEHGYFFVISPKDRLILSAPDQGRILEQMPPKGARPLLDRRLEEGFEGPGIFVSKLGIEHLSAARTMTTTGWMVLAVSPTEELFAPLERIKRQIYVAALLISLAVAAILRFFLARQFAPLAQAARALRRMTARELPLAAIPVVRQDEIGDLVANFNLLVVERSRLEQSLQAEIVERKQAHESLRESKDRLDGIYRSVGEGIISIDGEQRIVLCNSAAARIFGYSATELIGQPVSALLPERYRTQGDGQIGDPELGAQAIRSMGTYELIYGKRASGEEFPIEATISESGIPPNKLYTIILRDITERRQTEQAREQFMRQLESLSARLATAQEEERRRIAYELHEELGQELMALSVYLGMLGGNNGRTTAAVSQQDALAVVAHATERVRTLVLELEPRELEDFGLDAAVRSYCQRQALAGGWNLHIDAPKPDVRAPQSVERACFRVLQEGLSNVRNHARATAVWVHVHQSADQLQLRIRDNGIGFDRNALREDGRRVHRSLGLFGMQIRAKQVDGVVEIQSAVGAGTEVRAVFPLHVTPVESMPVH